MRKRARTDELRRFELFSECSERELRAILSLVSELSVGEGTVLVREGSAGREAYIIKEGKARVTLGSEQLATLGPGDVFGEMALLHRAARSATVSAETAVTLLVLNAGEFYEMLRVSPSVARKVSRQAAQRGRASHPSTTALD